MPNSVIYKEKYGAKGGSSTFIKTSGNIKLVAELNNGVLSSADNTLYKSLKELLVEVFLPQGYPDSVRNDYCSYQIWDTIQAFCSTISGILTTHAIMKSVGVGDASASALSATITWVMKDGIGMIGRILFAWWRGHTLDTDSKKWRLFADFLNDLAMFFELLLLPMYGHNATIILCLTTSMKGIVGVAAGASRAAITQHHAIRGNNGDVSAKDGSQETCVNLVASTVAMTLLTYTQSNMMIWLLFTFVTCLHMYANYRAIKSLGLVTFNRERLSCYLRHHLETRASYSPLEVNQWESVIAGFSYREKQLCGYNISLGHSVHQLVKKSHLVYVDQMLVIADAFRHRPYLLVPDCKGRVIYVVLNPAVNTRVLLQAYLHSVLVAITLCSLDNINLDILQESHNIKVLVSLHHALEELGGVSVVKLKCPLEVLTVVDDIIDQVFDNFFDGIKTQGWSTENHSLEVDEWRGEWMGEWRGS